MSLAVTDYGDSNPLLMDYYGMEPLFYRQTFESKGDSALAERVVQLYKEVNRAFRSFRSINLKLVARQV